VAYEKSVEFYGLVAGLERKLVRHDPFLAERLRQASTAISMKIAGGAAAARRVAKARRYRAALAAITECSAILDLFGARCKGDAALERCRGLVEEIASLTGSLHLNASRRMEQRPRAK
jgi:hypothetical protein